MKSTGGDIIKLKDQIHTKWFDLQRTKRGNHNYTFLSKPIYDEIVRLGHEALAILQEIEPSSSFIRRIQYPLHEVQRKSWVAEDIAFIGPTPHYVMTPEAGKDVITQDINRLANMIHHAGISLIKEMASYCGCSIATMVKDIKSINTGVLKYCEGALRLGNKRAMIMGDGDTIEHRPGAATNHANTIKFIPTEKGTDIEMEYVESGDENWEDRGRGVRDYVENLGGECEDEYTFSKCHIPDLSDEEILKLALIISQLKDIDLLDSDCIPLAFSLIEQQANDLQRLEPKTRIWEEPWERIPDMAGIMDCAESIQAAEKARRKEKEEREQRPEIKARRYKFSIEYLDARIDFGIETSKRETCTAGPYDCLCNYNFAETIREECELMKKETLEPYGWCMDLADQRKLDIKDAANNLISRCPPEGIILGLEASGSFMDKYYISRIEDICELVDNQDCLDVLSQVEARETAGIKSSKLKLKGEVENEPA